ncbi:MAG: response regulator transcription factor [Clostridiales bacterium]|jgi:DNA-binding response OmpR family regulator|nr:response regulator transcription factor [Clostridiales bacterium]
MDNRKKVLIIEDDKDIALLERDYLEISGYSAAIALTGGEAKKALAERCDLVLLDIMLPGADGLELLKLIRNERHLDIPVIIVSAKKADADKILGLGLGADDYLVKPFSPSELVARVKAHISRYERLTAKEGGRGADIREIIEVRDLRIDVAARQVFVRGKEAILTNKEFDLLIFLARNPNRVFRKDDIFDKVWGMDAIGDTATITVHVKKLREKIEDNPSEPKLIETVWGAGYRFKM